MRKNPDLKVLKEINELFEKAENEAKINSKISKNYIKKARKNARRANISLRKYRMLFCHKCNSFFVPGLNCQIRIKKDNKIIKKSIKCLECGSFLRYIVKNN